MKKMAVIYLGLTFAVLTMHKLGLISSSLLVGGVVVTLLILLTIACFQAICLESLAKSLSLMGQKKREEREEMWEKFWEKTGVPRFHQREE